MSVKMDFIAINFPSAFFSRLVVAQISVCRVRHTRQFRLIVCYRTRILLLAEYYESWILRACIQHMMRAAYPWVFRHESKADVLGLH